MRRSRRGRALRRRYGRSAGSYTALVYRGHELRVRHGIGRFEVDVMKPVGKGMAPVTDAIAITRNYASDAAARESAIMRAKGVVDSMRGG